MADYNNQTMTEGACPVFLEDTDEKEQSRRLSAYLQNLHDRLRRTIQHHQDAVHSSMQLLREVEDVAGGMMQSAKTGSRTPAPKIRRLIMGFETVNGANAPQNPTVPAISLSADLAGDRALLVDFETLNESQTLRESIVSFKRAGESMEKVLAVLEIPKSKASQLSSKPPASQLSTKRNLREKIEAFNKGEKLVDTCRHFTNCFSTSHSADELHPATEGHNVGRIVSRTNSGYEGDVDTEAELADVSSTESGLDAKQ